jgi:hypothetical protein
MCLFVCECVYVCVWVWVCGCAYVCCVCERVFVCVGLRVWVLWVWVVCIMLPFTNR